jgi:hypothetical protein
MSCPECGLDLTGVPVGVPCPRCGSVRRDAAVVAPAPSEATAAVGMPTIKAKVLWDGVSLTLAGVLLGILAAVVGVFVASAGSLWKIAYADWDGRCYRPRFDRVETAGNEVPPSLDREALGPIHREQTSRRGRTSRFATRCCQRCRSLPDLPRDIGRISGASASFHGLAQGPLKDKDQMMALLR